MDIQLPGMSGVQALGQLRADPATHAIPVIAVTASVMAQERQKVMGARVDDNSVDQVVLVHERSICTRGQPFWLAGARPQALRSQPRQMPLRFVTRSGVRSTMRPRASCSPSTRPPSVTARSSEGLEVDVAGPKRHAFARPESGLRERRQQGVVKPVGLGRSEHGVASLPRQWANLLEAFRL
jgi:CheY-like chemotaxis protein